MKTLKHTQGEGSTTMRAEMAQVQLLTQESQGFGHCQENRRVREYPQQGVHLAGTQELCTCKREGVCCLKPVACGVFLDSCRRQLPHHSQSHHSDLSFLISHCYNMFLQNSHSRTYVYEEYIGRPG